MERTTAATSQPTQHEAMRRVTGILALCGVTPVSAAQASDPAARGLEAFVLGPRRAVGAATAPFEVRVFGFLDVVTPRPLSGAQIQATWDPKTTGIDLPHITARSDAAGWAHLDLPVPPGTTVALRALIQIRHRSHARTIEVDVERQDNGTLRLFATENIVIPGSRLPVWAFLSRWWLERRWMGTHLQLAPKSPSSRRPRSRVVSGERRARGVCPVRRVQPRRIANDDFDASVTWRNAHTKVKKRRFMFRFAIPCPERSKRM